MLTFLGGWGHCPFHVPGPGTLFHCLVSDTQNPPNKVWKSPVALSASLPPRLIPDFICKHLFALAKNSVS